MTLRAVVILAAGHGTRMRSPLPKVLHAVGGRTMIDRAIDAALAVGATKIVVVCGPHAPRVCAHVTTRLGPAAVAIQTEPRGTAHAVSSAHDALADFEGDVLVTTADAPLLDAASLRAAFEARAQAADLVVLGFKASQPGAYGRLILDPQGGLERIVEAADATAAEREVTLCNSGVLAAPSRLLFAWLAQVDADNVKHEFYLTDVVAIARRLGHSVAAVVVPEVRVLGVNSQAELAAAEAIFQRERRAAALADGVAMPAPETVMLAYDTVLEPGCHIEPYVVFGPGVRVAAGVVVRSFSHLEGASIEDDAQVGPFARLRPGAQVGPRAHVGNFVELKNLRLGEGAKANHLSYLGDGVVGAGTNIGAGVIFCNYDGFRKHRTEIGVGAFVGSNVALVAPVTVGAGAYVASGSVVTRDVTPNALGIGRAEQVEKAGWAIGFRDRMTPRK